MVFYPNPKESTVEVLELLMFQNSGDRTFVGAGEGGKGNAGETLHFTLPEGASHAMLQQGLSDEQVQWHESGFCSLAPVYPSQEDTVYSYVPPYSGKGTLRLVRPLDYRPAEVLVMTYGNQGHVTGQSVVSQGPTNVQGEEGEYGLYRVVLGPSQSKLDSELSALGGGGVSNGDVKLLAGVLTGVGLIGVLFFAVVLKRRRAISRGSILITSGPVGDRDREGLG